METTTQQPSDSRVDVSSTRLLSAALTIIPGLLASGHYTEPYDGEGSLAEHDSILRYDNGKDWKEVDNIPVFARRYSALAVTDSIELAKELIRQCEIDAYAESLTDNARHELPPQRSGGG